MSGNRQSILGYEVAGDTLSHCIATVMSWVDAPGRARWIACLNPHSCVVAGRDRDFDAALHAADMLIPDGIGILMASRLLRAKLSQRITGGDLFLGCMAALNARGDVGVFFLGSTAAELAKIRERVAADYPKVRFAGSYAPPFADEFSREESGAMIAAINAADPEVLWVGMTAPKQEKWLWQNLGQLNVRVAAAIGAVFDFYSGRVTRANPLLRNLGLEWLSRLLREPRRMWRRNVVSSPVFLLRVINVRLRAGRRKSG